MHKTVTMHLSGDGATGGYLLARNMLRVAREGPEPQQEQARRMIIASMGYGSTYDPPFEVSLHGGGKILATQYLSPAQAWQSAETIIGRLGDHAICQMLAAMFADISVHEQAD